MAAPAIRIASARRRRIARLPDSAAGCCPLPRSTFVGFPRMGKRSESRLHAKDDSPLSHPRSVRDLSKQPAQEFLRVDDAALANQPFRRMPEEPQFGSLRKSLTVFGIEDDPGETLTRHGGFEPGCRFAGTPAGQSPTLADRRKDRPPRRWRQGCGCSVRRRRAFPAARGQLGGKFLACGESRVGGARGATRSWSPGRPSKPISAICASVILVHAAGFGQDRLQAARLPGDGADRYP